MQILPQSGIYLLARSRSIAKAGHDVPRGRVAPACAERTSGSAGKTKESSESCPEGSAKCAAYPGGHDRVAEVLRNLTREEKARLAALLAAEGG